MTPCIALADISLVYPQQSQCESNLSAIQVSSSRMRIDSVMQGRKYSMLFDGMEGIVTSLDHSNHSFHQIEVDEDALDYNTDVMSSTGNFIANKMNEMQAQMKKQCEQMEKQGYGCANMPDMASMMQNAQSMATGQMPVIEIKSTDKIQAVAGMACKTYDRYQNGIRSSEECYVETKNLVMPDKDKKYLLRNMKVMHHFAKSMIGLTDKLMAGNEKTSGMPDPADRDVLLSQICFSPDGDEAGRIEAQISNMTINAGNFEIPPGYSAMNISDQGQ